MELPRVGTTLGSHHADHRRGTHQPDRSYRQRRHRSRHRALDGPSTNNGSAITAYAITPYLGTAAQPAHIYTSTATTQTVTGLQPGKTYTFTVAATNHNGTSTQSDQSNAVTPT